MQIAFAVAILLGISLPLVGSTAVYKRLSSSGDALAHSSLAGVAIGLASGLSPLWMSVIACIVSFLFIEVMRKKFAKFSEIGVVIVLSGAIGIAGILSRYTSASNFDSYLFGSILLISNRELIICSVLTLVIVLFSILFYPQIFSILYSESESKVNRIPVTLLNFIMDLLLSITIAIGSKIVGSLVVSSLIVLPTATALQFRKGYKTTMILSLIFSILSMTIGLTVSYYLDWKPGATIVTLSVILLILVFFIKWTIQSIERIKTKSQNRKRTVD